MTSSRTTNQIRYGSNQPLPERRTLHAGPLTAELENADLRYVRVGGVEIVRRLYFAVRADFPCDVIPEDVGLILADRYGAELVREGMVERLSAARRKAIMLRFARAAALRLQLHLDPGCNFL